MTCRVISAPHLDRSDHPSAPGDFATLSSAFRHEVDVVLVARNQHDRPVTNREDEKDTLRLGAVNFHAFQFSKTDKSGCQRSPVPSLSVLRALTCPDHPLTFVIQQLDRQIRRTLSF